MLTLLLSVFLNVGVGQWDVTTQPVLLAQNQLPKSVSTNNLGQFVASASGNPIQLIGNDGKIIGTTSSNITSTSNVVVSVGHWQDYWIVTSAIDNQNQPVLQIRRSTGLYSSNYASTRFSGFLATVPPVGLTLNVVPGSGTAVEHIEAVSDVDNIYITWQTNTRRIGYAVINFYADPQYIRVQPSDVLDNNGNPAVGSIPTISCNRWGRQIHGNPEVHIAYARDAQPRNIPTDFKFTSGVWVPQTNVLVQPTNPNEEVKWVRVVTFEDRIDQQLAQPVHYFYGVQTQGLPAPGSSKLYTTNGIAINPAINPLTQELIFEPNVNNPMPPMGTSDDYNLWSDGTQSVMCSYKHRNDANPIDGTQIISVTRQDGTLNDINIFQSLPNIPITYFTLSSNQMGTFSLYDHDGMPAIWRNFQTIKADLIESTFASGRVDMENPNAGDTPFEIKLFHWDTLRILGDRNDGQSFRFRDPNILITTFPKSEDIDWDFPHWLDIPQPAFYRAHMIFDNSSRVDFNTKPGGGFVADIYGSILYNGTEFVNMNQNIFGGRGITAIPDTAEDYSYVNILFSEVTLNAPLTLDNGSTLFGHKTYFNFSESSSQGGIAKVTINGVNSAVLIDSSHLYFGSTSKTVPLTQIEMNPQNLDNQNQTLLIRNSHIATGFQSTSPIFEGPPNASRSDILVKKPYSVNLDRNRVKYVYLEVRDPVYDVQYNRNTVYSAREALNLNWNLLTKYGGTIGIKYNGFQECWRIGNVAASMTDVEIDNFRIVAADLGRIEVSHNLMSQWLISEPTDDHVGILFDRGTNGAINFNNIIHRHSIGIHTNAQGNSKPFVCSNVIEGDENCNAINIGIKQDGPTSGGGYTKLNDVSFCNIGYFATDADKSILIANILDDNNVGAKFGESSKTVLDGSHAGADDFAGYNKVRNNNTTQIELQGSAEPFLGLQTGDIKWGQNIFVAGTNEDHLSYTSGGTYILPAINEVSQNQWTPAISVGVIAPNAEPKCPNTGYTNNSNVTSATASFSCGVDWTRPNDGKLNNSILSIVADDCYYYSVYWPDSLCLYWKAVSYINVDNQRALDTMRLYVENYPFSTVTPGRTLSGINKAGSITFDLWGAETGNSPHYWVEHYNWLVKIQPINPERVYQKEVMLQLVSALDYFDRNAAANMLYNYSLIFGDDSSEVDLAWRTIRGIRETQERAGEDTTEFYILSFPLKPIQSAVSPSDDINLSELIATRNPFTDVLELKYRLAKSGMVRIDVYDLLGRAVYSEGQGYKQGGEYVLSLQAKSWSPGSYYVRLSTPSGEVKTVKLLKE